MTSKLGANQLYAIKMLDKHGCLTTTQLAEMLGMKDSNRAAKLMCTLRDRRIAYISGWGNGNRSIWSLGDKPDAVKVPMPKTIMDKRYRKKAENRLGKKLSAMVFNAMKRKDSSVIVIDGVKIWERGRGILV